ncbi:DUF7144 family membrane protein [Micromonospora wenchangensis]|uniref:DUF7144 family membrane protein n=1 Tax=Micromonospora wenchangensis TaxID=1185415 RepID=UPI003820C474
MVGGHTGDRGLRLAGVLLGVAGVFDAVAGAADLTGDRYVSVVSGAVQQHDVTGWAWTHLVAAVFMALAGALVPLDRRWSTSLALAAVVISVVVHLFLLTYRPVQTVLVLGLALAAARLVARHSRPVGRRRRPVA